MKEDKPKKSGSAIIMHVLIGITAVLTVACFVLYYMTILRHPAVLWTGIISFLILYQFVLRLALGTFNTYLSISYTQRIFREMRFEQKIYKKIRVKKWKEKVPTYNPELFVLKDYTLEEIANTMAKVETDHWANVLISLSTLVFIIPWGRAWFFVPIAVFAILFDMVFISIQRYNRPRVIKALEKQSRHQDKTL